MQCRYKSKPTPEQRRKRTALQARIMLAFSEGVPVQVLAANGMWLNCNDESGFGCGWNWTNKVYRIRPDRDSDRLNEQLEEFYSMVPETVRDLKANYGRELANRYWDNRMAVAAPVSGWQARVYLPDPRYM